MHMREFRFLMGGETEITLDSLKSLLADNEIKGFDPVAEAFKVGERVTVVPWHACIERDGDCARCTTQRALAMRMWKP